MAPPKQFLSVGTAKDESSYGEDEFGALNRRQLQAEERMELRSYATWRERGSQGTEGVEGDAFYQVAECTSH